MPKNEGFFLFVCDVTLSRTVQIWGDLPLTCSFPPGTGKSDIPEYSIHVSNANLHSGHTVCPSSLNRGTPLNNIWYSFLWAASIAMLPYFFSCFLFKQRGLTRSFWLRSCFSLCPRGLLLIVLCWVFTLLLIKNKPDPPQSATTYNEEGLVDGSWLMMASLSPSCLGSAYCHS